MKKKWLMAFLLFALLFGGAWQMHSKQNRVYSPELNPVSIIDGGADRANAETNDHPSRKHRKPFGPREYMRIEPYSND